MNVIIVFLLVLFSFNNLFNNVLTDQVDRQLILTFLGQCKGKENLPVYLPDFRIEQADRHHYHVSGDIILRENFPKGFNLVIDIKKCSNPAISDSCKTFLNNMATSDICMMLELPLPSYSAFVRSLKPPLKCPLKQVTYHMENFVVDDALTKYMPASKSISYWNVTLMGQIGKREVACISFQMHARPASRQSRRN